MPGRPYEPEPRAPASLSQSDDAACAVPAAMGEADDEEDAAEAYTRLVVDPT